MSDMHTLNLEMPYLLPGCAAILLSSDMSIIVQLETNTGNENVG